MGHLEDLYYSLFVVQSVAGKFQTYGLVLTRVCKKRGTYRRLGMGNLYSLPDPSIRETLQKQCLAEGEYEDIAEDVQYKIGII